MNMKLNKTTVEVRLKDTHFKNRAGEIVPLDAPMSSWHEVEFLPEDTCEHEETICSECADSWATEHWVRVRTFNASWSSEETLLLQKLALPGARRALLTVEVNLDPVPGEFHTVESAQESVQAILRSSLSHYDPVVSVPTRD